MNWVSLPIAITTFTTPYPCPTQRPARSQVVDGALAEFELALKSDIGIYVVEFSDPQKRFRTYADLANAVSKQNK